MIQGNSKWLSGYSCPVAIMHQIRETTTIWQFHSKIVCTVSKGRVRVYPEGTKQNRHWNHHRWHAKRTRLSCWCSRNHKGCTYRAPVSYVTKTWSVILNKKIHILLSQVYCVWQVVKTPTITLNNPVYSVYTQLYISIVTFTYIYIYIYTLRPHYDNTFRP